MFLRHYDQPPNMYVWQRELEIYGRAICKLGTTCAVEMIS